MLFFGKKKTNPYPHLGWLGADMHSHLLPGIDDGSPDLETSLGLIRGLAALGYRKLITTPHVLWDIYPNTTEQITESLKETQEAVAAAGINVELQAAAEYFIDEHFEAELKAKSPLLTIGGNMVLVEFSMVMAPIDLQDVLFQMQVQNYQPVIAHPERYIYLINRRSFFDELREAGCLFQLNLLSLTGHYGRAVAELAEYLLKNDYYSFAGTDLHSSRHLDGLQKLQSSAGLQRLRESGLLRNDSL